MKFAILLALTLTALAAQTIEVRSFSQLAPLDGNWKFSTSDDPRFAAPDFDDSAWRTVRVPGEAMPRPMGVSWIRFQVQLPDTDEPLTLLLPPLSTSYGLFVNGRLVGRFGDPEIRVDAPEIFAVPSGARNLTVAIRSRKVAPTLSPLLAARGAWIGTSQAIAAKQRQVALEVRWRSVIHLATMSATAMAGLFFVLLRLWRRDAWDYFWCGLWLITAVALRPSTVAPWMLDGFSINQIGIPLYGLLALTVYAWERLFHHLLGTQLSTWVRRCQQGLLLLCVASLLLVPIVGAPVFQINAPLGVLLTIVLLVVYVDLSRRSPRREETIWMHAAVALTLGGTIIFAASAGGVGSRWLADVADVQHAALIARGAGTLLFAGVMAMVLNRRSARVQSEQQRLAQEMRAGAEMQELLHFRRKRQRPRRYHRSRLLPYVRGRRRLLLDPRRSRRRLAGRRRRRQRQGTQGRHARSRSGGSGGQRQGSVSGGGVSGCGAGDHQPSSAGTHRRWFRDRLLRSI